MTYRVLWWSDFSRFVYTVAKRISKNVFNAFVGTICCELRVISRHAGSLSFLSSLRRCLLGKNTGERKKPKACANGSGERIQYVFECLFVQQTNCIFGLEPSLRVFRLGFWADRVFHIRPFTLHLHRKPRCRSTRLVRVGRRPPMHDIPCDPVRVRRISNSTFYGF